MFQDKAWAFERVVGMDLKGHEGRMVSNVPSRRDCEEACLRETGFRCRSAVYNTVSLDCALSQETRRTRPEAYAPGRNTEYLENQCVSSGRTQRDLFYFRLTFPTFSAEQTTAGLTEFR